MQIFDLFDVKRKGLIDFGDFVRSLNVFHPNGSLEDKISCKWKIELFSPRIKSILRNLKKHTIISIETETLDPWLLRVGDITRLHDRDKYWLL